MHRILFVVGGAVALGACSTLVPRGEAPPENTAGFPAVNTVLKAADGADRGTATLTMADGRMRLTVDASGLARGVHGVHIHDVAKCEGPAFASAGTHWNPTMKMHGRDNPMGAHEGDLPNLMIGTDGRGSISIDVPGIPAQLLDADGAAVVIHADPDDYKTDPSGNSGGRIACGVLTAP
jgi:superoxide dismutase, Cu-Zn family